MAKDTGLELSARERQSMATDVDEMVQQERQQQTTPQQQIQHWVDTARHEHERDVRDCLHDMVHTASAGQVPPAPPLGTTRLTAAQQRQVIERQFPLLRREVLEQSKRHRVELSRRQHLSIRQHSENARKSVVQFTGMRRDQGGAWRPNQKRLLEVQSPQDFAALIKRRKEEIMLSLSTDYLAVRASYLRLWIHHTVECKWSSPWQLDDGVMADFLVGLSLRFTSWGAVSAAQIHVVEFMRGALNMVPPPMPQAQWWLKKLKRTMAKEKPQGRRVRPGLDNRSVTKIVTDLYKAMKAAPPQQQRLYANLGAAISLCFEKALRTGEACPGEDFDRTKHLTRRTIAAVLLPRAQLRQRGTAVIIQPPVRKTTYTSPVAAHKSTLPMVIRLQSKADYSFAIWGPLLHQYDPCPENEWAATPAFRLDGRTALSTADVREALLASAKRVLSDWKMWSLGCHSMRIGRENCWAATGLAQYLAGLTGLLNDSMTHTSDAGREPYDRPQARRIVELDAAAETVVLQPLETLYDFGQDRSAHRPCVYMVPDPDSGELRLHTIQQEMIDSSDDDEDVTAEVRDEPSAPLAVASAHTSPLPTVTPSALRTGAAAQHFTQPAGRPRKDHRWCKLTGQWLPVKKPIPKAFQPKH
eukprot:SAG25_NODE_215_length_11684_cov_261.443677_10_plen_641_part_00